MDAAIIAILIAVCLHTYLHTKRDGVVLILTTFCLGVIVELTFVYIVSNRCHAEASVMIGQCCSLSSVLFYVGWMYSCYAIGSRVPLQSKFAKNLLVASLHPLFSLAYEIFAANCGLIVWMQSPPSSLQATFSRLIGGITGNGDMAFIRMTEQSLKERIMGVPIISVMFQFFFGVAFHWCRGLAKMIVSPTQKRKTRKLWVTAVDALTEVFVVAILAPFVALVPLSLLIKLVGGKQSFLSSNWAGGRFAFLTPLFTGKNSEIWLKAASCSILIASVTAVFADPIFRKVNRHNISSFSSNVELVAEAGRNRQGVPTLRKLAQAYTLLVKEEDRDLILLSIPYTFFACIVGLVIRQIYSDWIIGLPLIEILLPYRVVAIAVSNCGFIMFTYFNFSELEWKVVQKEKVHGKQTFFSSRSSVFNTISPNRILAVNAKENVTDTPDVVTVNQIIVGECLSMDMEAIECITAYDSTPQSSTPDLTPTNSGTGFLSTSSSCTSIDSVVSTDRTCCIRSEVQ